MYQAIDWLQHRAGWVRRDVNRVFYNYLSQIDRTSAVTFMDYGYADTNDDARPIPLYPEDEPNRYCLQLYHQVASTIDLRGQDVLEVGSGRGGGASFVKRYLGPRTMTGVDYSEKAVAFCQQHYQIEGLRYIHGDAENLPLENQQFDTVINIESSHCYGAMQRFLDEVQRVLKPNGHLLWSDHRPAEKIAGVIADMQAAGFEVVEEQVISPNVLKSMTIQGQRNRDLIDRNVPGFARQIFYHFSGVEGTHIYNQIASGELVYLRMVLHKVGRANLL